MCNSGNIGRRNLVGAFWGGRVGLPESQIFFILALHTVRQVTSYIHRGGSHLLLQMTIYIVILV